MDKLEDDDYKHYDETEDAVGLESGKTDTTASRLKSVGTIIDLFLVTSEKVKVEVIALVFLFFRRHYLKTH